MRAREPDKAGCITRDGIDVAYEVFGAGERTIVFTPISPIVESRAWKGQVPYLARHARVVTIDPRGNGRSGRPTDQAAYADLEFVADTIAVMDELGVEAAVLAGICWSGWNAAVAAAKYPERVAGLIVLAPWLPFAGPELPARSQYSHDDDPPNPQGWAKHNRHHIARDWPDFARFFLSELLPEPHSSKPYDDALEWALQTTGAIHNAYEDAPACVADAAGLRNLLAEIRCPSLVIHGTDDHCQPAARAAFLADAIGADRITIDGAGHLPMAREPVAVNLAIREFLDRVWPAPVVRGIRTTWRRGAPRVLYLSSPIGLGHARRDIAIVDELRASRPDVQVDWLAQAPLSDWLQRRGMSVHPASAALASEPAHIDSLAGEHDLHAFQAIREMDEILVANFMVFAELVEHERYDLWVGDEAWELDHFLFENPQLKTAPYAWLTDFVGWLPMTDGREEDLTADYNAEMLEHIATLPRMRDRAVFVGNPDDIVEDPFGPGLPGIRSWTEQHYDFAGYVTGFDPAEVADRQALRAEFGWAPGEPVCVVAVGGSGVGSHLLRRAVAAFPLAASRVPGLRMVVVPGPRIDPASLPQQPGVEVHAFLPDLHRRLAAADMAIVQGGLTTTMELVATGRPFVYVPLRNHFEQNIHVRRRLANYRAGTCMPWVDATPDHLADVVAREIGRTVSYRPVETDGAARAARLLADLF
jgi:pimeloyl-ACP methyl ester carboxylesterase/predicted glycosyltransferase